MRWRQLYRTLFFLSALTPVGRSQGIVVYLGDVGTNQEVVPLGDVDADGQADWATTGATSGPSLVKVYSAASLQPLFSTSHASNGGVAAGGDFDGDGREDLIIGETGPPGRVSVRSGFGGYQLLEVSGPPGDLTFGISVAYTGDVNADGTPDLLIGSTTYDGPLQNSGRVLVASGSDGATLYELFGDSPQTFLGAAVTGMGDLDGDGVDDFAAGGYGTGSSGANSAKGRVAVYSGASGELLYRIVSAGWDWFGSSVQRVGDLDGDGADELWIAAPFHDQHRGRAALHSGRTGTLLREVFGSPETHISEVCGPVGDTDADGDVELGLSTRVGSEAWMRIVSSGDLSTSFDFRGRGAAPAGDLDGDGRGEVMTAAQTELLGLREGDCGSSMNCQGQPHSGQQSAVLRANGTFTASSNAFSLELSELPPNAMGWLMYSDVVLTWQFGPTQIVPFGDGIRCIGLANPQASFIDPHLWLAAPPLTCDGAGSARIPIDLTGPPFDAGPGAIGPGREYAFQFFFRDPGGPGGTGFNSTNGLVVRFCP